MSKKEYLKPQISIIMFEPQAILAGSGGSVPATGGITNDEDITSGDEDNVWEYKSNNA